MNHLAWTTSPDTVDPSQLNVLARDSVEVQVDDPYLAEVDTVDLSRAVASVLLAEGCAAGQVTVVLTDDEAVAALNHQYRGDPGPTDVLSFSNQEPAPGFVSPPDVPLYIGDIIIALPFTRRQAAELGRPLADELRMLVVHGTLHLLGYDHDEPDSEARMWSRQEQILAGLER